MASSVGFERLWNHVSRAATAAVGVVRAWISDHVGRLWTNVTGAFSSLWTSINGALGTLRTSITAGLGGLWTSISTGLGRLWTSVSTGLGQLWTSVSGAVSSLWTSIVGAVAGLWTSISQGFGSLWTGITGAFSGLWTSISGAFSSLWARFMEWGGNLVTSITTMFDGAVSAIGSWVSEALAGMAGAMGEALTGLWTWLSTEVPKFLTGAAGFINEAVVTPILDGLSWVFDRLKDVATGMVNSIVDLFKGHSPVKPEEALGLGVAALVTAVAVSGLGTTIVDLASTKVLGCGLELRALGQLVTDFVNPGMFMAATIGVLMYTAVRTPLTQHFNNLFRPAIPSTGRADDMLFHGEIDEAYWRQIYAYHGWKDEHIDAWRGSMYSHPRVFTVLGMLADPEVPESWVRHVLAVQKMAPDDVEILVGYKRRLIEARRLAGYDVEKAKLIVNAKLDFVKGYIDEATLRADLAAVDRTADEIEFDVADAIADRKRKQKDVLLDVYEDAYLKDLKTYEDLEEDAARIIVDADALDLFLTKAYIRKYKKAKAG